MKVIDQSWSWVSLPILPLQIIESAGRTCYKSEKQITTKSSSEFAKMILKNGHESVIEHTGVSVRFITNRGVTHELVRHRLSSFSQESTRYVNYGGEDITFIRPVWHFDFKDTDAANNIWKNAMIDSEKYYKNLLKEGWRPEQAREVLPNSLKTEIIVTANLREIRHILNLRCSPKAHPQIRALMRDFLIGIHKEIPVIFDDLYNKYFNDTCEIK